MRILIKKIPGILFVLVTFSPFILTLLTIREIIAFDLTLIRTFGIPFSLGVSGIWFASLNDYFSVEAMNSTKDKLGLFILLDFGLAIAALFTPDLRFLLSLLSALGFVYITVLLVKKVRLVFSKRSVWFLTLELLFPIFGMTTLTPEVQRWEKQKKKEF